MILFLLACGDAEPKKTLKSRPTIQRKSPPVSGAWFGSAAHLEGRKFRLHRRNRAFFLSFDSIGLHPKNRIARICFEPIGWIADVVAPERHGSKTIFVYPDPLWRGLKVGGHMEDGF